MINLVTRFWDLNRWVKLVLWLCLVGVCINTILITRDLATDGVLLRLHVGFWILYAGQIVFILLGEKQVWILALLQGFMALFTSADFTFMPLVRLVGNVVYTFCSEPSLENVKVYQYLMTSASFSLQLLSAYILFSLLPSTTLKTPSEQA